MSDDELPLDAESPDLDAVGGHFDEAVRELEAAIAAARASGASEDSVGILERSLAELIEAWTRFRKARAFDRSVEALARARAELEQITEKLRHVDGPHAARDRARLGKQSGGLRRGPVTRDRAPRAACRR